MSKKKYGAAAAPQIPDLFSRGKNVYPIIPYRARLAASAAGAANNEREIVDFDLQFEDNEVMDIVGVEVNYEHVYDDITAFNSFIALLALLEDPDLPATTDIGTEAFFETNASLVWFNESGVMTDLATSGMAAVPITDYAKFMFPQPYTVARNVSWIIQASGTENDVIVITTHATIWGRRRIASDEEFKNIIYRQRF